MNLSRKFFIIAAFLVPVTSVTVVSADPSARDVRILGKLLQGASPHQPLWKVLSLIQHHWNSENFEIGDEDYLKRGALGQMSAVDLQLPAADLSDHGEIAKMLARQGYNYMVLRNLKTLLRDGAFDVPAYMATHEGLEVAGIPPYLDVVLPPGWETNLDRYLEILYDEDIYNTLHELKAVLEKVVLGADARKQTVGRKIAAWVFNRSRRTLRVVDSVGAIEATLNQFQLLKASIFTKIEASQQNSDKKVKLERLAKTLEDHKSGFLALVQSGLESAKVPNDPRDPQNSYWLRMDRALQKAKLGEPEVRKLFLQLAATYIEQIDQIEGTVKADDRYKSDTPAELEYQRVLQEKKIKELSENWIKNSTETYYKRDDVWIYKHFHSEQHGPYVLTSQGTRSKPVNFTRIAPLAEETEVVERLIEIGKSTVEEKFPVDRVKRLQAEVTQLKKQHDEYVNRGPIQSHDKIEHFKKRNEILSELLNVTLDSTYRQEAHANNGYVGLLLSEDLERKYQSTLDSLAAKSRRIRLIKIVSGVVTTAGLCAAYFLN